MKLHPSGFREYDARWLYPEQIDDDGMRQLGLALGTYLQARGRNAIIVGHDYRAYSEAVKQALVSGLVEAGAAVSDIGLCLSPMAYFAQTELGIASVAMVTASHNENGWTGVKMGCDAPLTFGVQEITQLKQIALQGTHKKIAGGSYKQVDNIAQPYIADIIKNKHFDRKLKLVIACGNGTAGKFAPDLFTQLGLEIVPLHCDLNWDFPHYTPNPENMKMMEELAESVVATHADLGLAFDGDGDRCGFVDEKGEIIFADKVGVLIARALAAQHQGAHFIADVKSTGVFATDPELKAHRAETSFWMTGHSHMKRRLNEIGALAGFEKSGHFFFAPPVGRGYDDGLLSGVLLAELIANQSLPLSALYQSLPQSWTSPTMAPFCADEKKYQVVDEITNYFQACKKILGRVIKERMTVNGIRVVLEDGSWLLVRASSNKPSLVIVVESVRSHQDMKNLFDDLDQRIRTIADIGDYDQKI